MGNSQKIYFISDTHLGLYPYEKSLEREKKLVRWLDTIKKDISELYMMGDIFDFWHEHKRVIPRGFSRFLGKIAELSDLGVKIHYFTGNHDVWAYSYFKTEFGATIYHKPVKREINGIKFFIAHGDGLGPGDKGYKFLKWIFRNRVLQWLFARLHPNFSMWLGTTWSKHSRYAKGIVAEEFAGTDKEQQIVFSGMVLKEEHVDYFIFGHRHIPYDIQLGTNARCINLGDWIYNFSYGVFDGKSFSLQCYESNCEIIKMKV